MKQFWRYPLTFPAVAAVAVLAACGATPGHNGATITAVIDTGSDLGSDLSSASDSEGDAAGSDATPGEDADFADNSTPNADAGDDTSADAAADDGAEPADGSGDTAQGDSEAGDAVATDANVSDAVATDATTGDTATGDAAADAVPQADSQGDAAGDTTTSPGLSAPCDSDDDCQGSGTGKVCNVTTHACALCMASKDCPAGELCQGNACKPAVACKSDTNCKATSQVCDKAEGLCVNCASDLDCAGGKCVDHACQAVKTCKSSLDCPAVCDQTAGVCVQCKESVDCPTDQACFSGTCKPILCKGPLCSGGKSFLCKADGSGYEAGKNCDDKNACTDGDSCDTGLCKPGPAKVCDDQNPCTTDSCDPLLGCQFKANTAACDDLAPCTENDVCSGGACAGKPMVCEDGKVCTADACKDGNCVFVAQGGTCDDGNACTTGDACTGGACKGPNALVCSDDNPCTIDSCDTVKGCTFTATNGATCDDGNGCTTGDVCVGPVCQGVGKQCGDSNPCTDDGCSGGVCSYKANTKACDDGNPCTSGDVCTNGSCAGMLGGCDDKNPCTTDACLSVGCQHTSNTEPCDDGDACTTPDVCSGGVCASKPKNCDDANECTSDSCKAGVCQYAPVDGSCGGPGACSVCQAGKCAASAKGFEDTYGGANTDKFYGVAATADGGFLAAGSTASKGAGNDDGWLVKLDATGSLLWEKTFGGTGSDSFAGITPMGNGNFALVGTNSSKGNGNQVWLVVVDASGGLVNGIDKVFGSSYSDMGRAVAVNSAGLLIAGQKQVYASQNYYPNYGWLLQVDPTGNLLWDKDLTNMIDTAGVVAIGDQSVVLGHGNTTATNTQDIILQRLKSGGAQVWTVTIGSTPTDSGRELALLSDGSLLVSGRLGYNYTEATFVGRYDGTGKQLWKSNDANLTGDLNAVIESGKSLILAGNVRSNSQWDGRLVGLDLATGSTLWTQTLAFSATYDDQFFGAIPFGGGAAVVGAAYVGNGSSHDGWLMVVNDQGKMACECDTKCDDGNSCTLDTCYAGTCKSKPAASGTFCLTTSAAPGTCNSSQQCVSTCGNGTCTSGETIYNCPQDCKVTVAHPCDNFCGAKNTTYGCYCDALCKTQGDCCQASGAKGYSCAGSTCSICK